MLLPYFRLCPFLLFPRLVEVGRLTSVDTRLPDKRLLAELAVTHLAERSSPRTGGYFVGAHKTPSCVAAAGRACASSSFLLPPPTLFELNAPPFVSFLSFSFPCSTARSHQLPTFVTPAPLRAASNYLDPSPTTGRGCLPEPPELAGARKGAGGGVMEAPGSHQGPRGELEGSVRWCGWAW